MKIFVRLLLWPVPVGVLIDSFPFLFYGGLQRFIRLLDFTVNLPDDCEVTIALSHRTV